MATIFVALGTIPAGAPTRKLVRSLHANFASIEGVTYSADPFTAGGVARPPGVLVQTGADPDPDQAAIIAAIVGHDGADDPPAVGVEVPTVPSSAALPAEPPLTGRAWLVATETPPGLWLHIGGVWTQVA
ncbi:MAG: hypothetical protein OEZ01_00570 [Candidatus Heimdallarchaeota archaeon]|nr:hypothetical protein [Candidatus Heimdallarchaeota archaeon]MDH5676612.1 hypothetical protein [Myxococcales bacterium]